MRVFITSDANQESGVDEFVEEVCVKTHQHFKAFDYGSGLVGVVVILMCRNPELQFKKRIILSKKEKQLYLDIMLDPGEMMSLQPETRKEIIIERLANEIPTTLGKFMISHFDKEGFIEDLRNWLNGLKSNRNSQVNCR